jgi:4-diphosphocytidyl-2-C-methyl-D-erythritol kinase
MRFEEIAGGLCVETPAKINLHLEVGGKRADGFHEIDSLFQAVSLHDRIELRLRRDGAITLLEEGLDERDRNLVYRAASLLKVSFLPSSSPLGVDLKLTKSIPHGAGLGGGSSDAAATLVALARLWGLDVRLGDLEALGASLGSDVPFFFHGGLARCRGRGERVTPWADVPAGSLHYVLVCPRLAVSTRTIYEMLDRERTVDFTLTASSALDSMSAALGAGQLTAHRLSREAILFNRLEGVVCEAFPELSKVRDRLRREAFLAVLMSGSGSTFYGLCRGAGEAAELARTLAAELSVRPASEKAQVFKVSNEPVFRFPWLR